MMREALISLSRSRRMARLMSTNRLAYAAARRFIAGETLGEAIDVVSALNRAGMTASLDHLGENVTSEAEARAAGAAYFEIVDAIRASGAESSVSLKLTSLGLDLSRELAAELVGEIAAHAANAEPVLNVTIDMEGSPYTQVTLDLFHEVRRQWPNVGIVVQSYLYRTEEDIEGLIDVGATVRLCKGAYLEPPSIAYPDKADSDAAFLRCTARMLSPEALANGVYLGAATHDAAILDWTKAFAAEKDIPRDAFEFQMLNGVRRDLQHELAREGYRMRIYVPYGTHWYPYFMRRLAERPENVAFIVRNLAREIVPG